MDWGVAESLIVLALTALFQALKRIEIVDRNAQYIPLAAILLGILATVGWAVNTGACDNACQFEAVLKGIVFGAASSGIYEAVEVFTERKTA